MIFETPETENEYSKLKNSQPHAENHDNAENKIKIDEMRQNKIRELAIVTYTDMKVRASLKKF